MTDSLASWMIAGGPRADEHDQRVHHLVAIAEARRERAAERPTSIQRFRSWFTGASTVRTPDCCAV